VVAFFVYVLTAQAPFGPCPSESGGDVFDEAEAKGSAPNSLQTDVHLLPPSIKCTAFRVSPSGIASTQHKRELASKSYPGGIWYAIAALIVLAPLGIYAVFSVRGP
jgi:hypothetical protein